jgi:hypothetical protein
MCGGENIFGRDVGYMDAAICQCSQCQFRWIQAGWRSQIEEQQRVAFLELWNMVKVYCLHGLVVWPIFGVIHFLCVVPRPIGAFCGGGLSRAAVIIGLLLITGLCLGYALQVALNWTSRWLPNVRRAHILVPLLFAFSIGSTYGAVLGQIGISKIEGFDQTFLTRSESLSAILGGVLAMVATPIIIVRSRNLRIRKGWYTPPPTPKDPRWDS